MEVAWWYLAFKDRLRGHIKSTKGQLLNNVNYKHALELYKLYNSNDQNEDWIDLNVQQNFNGQNQKVQLTYKSRLRVGKTLLTNTLTLINNKIEYDWLNLTFDSFKVRCKNLFLIWYYNQWHQNHLKNQI